jgi:hypothetical protein
MRTDKRGFEEMAAAAVLLRGGLRAVYAASRFIYYLGGAAAVLWALWQWTTGGGHAVLQALHLPGGG